MIEPSAHNTAEALRHPAPLDPPAPRPAEPAQGLTEADTPGVPGTRNVPDAPRLPRLYLPRRRLWEQLDVGPDHGITLLVAPAGAGKTLGVGGWVRTSPHVTDARWVQADRSWTASRLLKVIDSPTGTDRFAPVADGAPGLVVVDDAHLLPSSTLRALDERLDSRPDDMRLVLLSRWDLPLSRLVPELMGNYSVLRGDLLRLTEAECAALIAEHGRTRDPAVVQAVSGRTQGWCAAVVLAARAIAVAPNQTAAARRYARGGSSAVDQLASEVFHALHPRERHLLLCVAGEDIVTADKATHLSCDAGAGDLLAQLENTGLLVTRFLDDPPGAAGASGDTQPSMSDDEPGMESADGSARYRIHPLLVEVVRRRLAIGGVEVAQAQATLQRAVRLDMARGDTGMALQRLMALNSPSEAAGVLAEHGPALLLGGQGDAIAVFTRRFPNEVEGHPDAWLTIALERWFNDDIAATRHWLDRCVGHLRQQREDDALRVRVACIRLVHARLGSEPAAAAVGHANRVVLSHLGTTTPDPLLPLLMAELGIAQAHLGELGSAEVNLTTAAALSRAQGSRSLTLSVLSHLALTLYMQGRERASIEVANGVIESGPSSSRHPRFSYLRAQIVHDLASMSDVPWMRTHEALPELSSEPSDLPSGDPVTQFWARIREARLALAGGSVVAAQQLLQVPATGLSLPEHLHVNLLIERGFLASMGADTRALRSVAAELGALGARGEAALLEGLSHELDGNRKAAAGAYGVAEADVTYAQPASRALALACQAQLLDALGQPTEALDRLREAATITEVRRNAVPFLGWSRQGTPIGTLLHRLLKSAPSEWIGELAALADLSPNMSTVLAPTTADLRERVGASEPTVEPMLSTREREVLNELARGATYADIAANLFVSENTVKTHISNLYGKLGASRRSEALAAARNQHLL